jgi:hypothetical protein
MATRASDATRMIDASGGGATAAAAKPRVGKQDRHFVTALSRGLDVLSCFRRSVRRTTDAATRSAAPGG